MEEYLNHGNEALSVSFFGSLDGLLINRRLRLEEMVNLNVVVRSLNDSQVSEQAMIIDMFVVFNPSNKLT